MDEEWRVIPGFSPYEASSHGRVRNSKSGRVLKPDFCKGYARVAPCFNNKARHHTVSRLVCLAFKGPPPEGKPDCRHLDGNSSNNWDYNLDWGSKKDNEQDKKAHGTFQAGERNGFARLTELQVAEIKRLKSEHISARRSQGFVKTAFGFVPQLAKDFGVTVECVKQILSGKNWRHV